ncbi:MAG: NAD-glutamate dehydrogenase [Rhodospirillaceae bacterium]|nr:NAD-glutamate dehydrogenase [Rhodospirillaceae bacterium]
MVRAVEKKPIAKLVDKIVSARPRTSTGLFGGAKASGSQTTEGYLRHYFSGLSEDDLSKRLPKDLAVCAFHHLKFARTRRKGETLVNVFNPDVKKDGWKSERTIIEIVVTDTPFLLDSVTAELNRCSIGIHLAIHPAVFVNRSSKGTLEEIFTDRKNKDTVNVVAESFIHIEINQQPKERLEEIKNNLLAVLSEVSLAVNDWANIRGQLATLIDELEAIKSKLPEEAVIEAKDFLSWLHDNHFTLLGYREYNFSGNGEGAKVKIIENTALGILKDQSRVVFSEIRDLAKLPPEVRKFIQGGDILTVNKTDTLSRVHRAVHMDSVGIKKYDTNGRVVGQRIFVGLFTAGVYSNSARSVPLLKNKINRVFERSELLPLSHDGKALSNILETYPRDELFQISDERLLEISLGVLRLQDRQKVALFIRHDDFQRFVSCLVYVPRDNYSTDLRLRMQHILENAIGGEVRAHYAQLGEQALARLHLVIKTSPGKILKYNERKLEADLREEARTWGDKIIDALSQKFGEEEGARLGNIYRNAFDAGYRSRFSPETSIADIEMAEHALHIGAITLSLEGAGVEKIEESALGVQLRLKVYNPAKPVTLSGILPVLEDFGLNVIEEMPHRIHPKGGGDYISMHDFGLAPKGTLPAVTPEVSENFHNAFEKVWLGEMESDHLNALVLFAGLEWREITVLRALVKYLRQTRISFSEDYMAETLVENSRIAKGIVDMFKARFALPAGRPTNKPKNKKALTDVVKKAATKCARIRKSIINMLDDVESADQDRILRRFINLIDASLRTNFFQSAADGSPKQYLSIKFSSGDIEELPLPRPRFEIFVYSPDIEGVHLRFGSVARGGLRWSDRREDFRTEILGLVKAQQVKNAVIVPVGSKGGFVVKRSACGGRDEFMAHGIECYKTFIRGLLDLTDNFGTNGQVIPPKGVLRHDDDDAYLVVAADKGTATFSDIANSVSHEYGFWLGDAFASGGSVGYDHKKMGITARGGWESVKRHFREMDIDTQTEDFTVTGVGDMSGDVFGNGMLLSKHIKLVGAFNHMHIFVDPDPDIKTTFAERKRLFNLPRSGWNDFNTKLISKGGGVFDRKSKWIALSPEMKKLFDTTADRATPNELMRMILMLDADLLWFGGIGTYIKSAHEGNVDAGDRVNDAVRIDGREVRARVIGEGANLGVTQRGRIECGLAGVRLNTDSVDNSAGVDCSDHEVNIKILLDQLVVGGKLTEAGRNSLLAKMTDEVGKLVLRDNYLQTQAMSVIQTQGMNLVDHQIRLMRGLEKSGRLNRDVEFLPDDETLSERALAGGGLSRPEISVLLSYSKIWLYDEILASGLPDSKYLETDLVNYFPGPLRAKHMDAICSHRLAREIITTCVTNSIVNRVGGTFVTQMQEKTGMRAHEITSAYIIVREIFSVRELWNKIEALDNKVSAHVQIAMMLDINALLDRSTAWALRNLDISSIGAQVSIIAGDMKSLAKGLETTIPKFYREDLLKRAEKYIDEGVPKDLAHAIAGLVNLASGPDIVCISQSHKLSVSKVGRLYFEVGARFRLGRLRAACEGLESQSHWQKLAVGALIDDLFQLQAQITSNVLTTTRGETDPKKAIPSWADIHQSAVERSDQLLNELRAHDINDIAMISVATQSLRALVEDSA